MSQDKEREFPPIVAVLAEWEDKNGTLAAVTPDEWMALMGPVSHAAVLQSPRQLRVALASQQAVKGEPIGWRHKQYGHVQWRTPDMPPEVADRYTQNGQWVSFYAYPPSREEKK